MESLNKILTQYYEKGFCPIPITKDEKSSDISAEDLLNSSPENIEQVMEWFKLSNIHWITGLIVSKFYGFLVLQVSSQENLERIKEKYSIPQTVCYKTTEGEWRFLFKYPEKLTENKVPQGIFDEKIEIRNRGLIMVPPMGCEWINSIFNNELAEMPQRLFETAKKYQEEDEKFLFHHKRPEKGLGNTNHKTKSKSKYVCSAVLADGSMVEMVYNSKEETKFAVFKDGGVKYLENINLPNGKTLKPIPAERDIIKNGVILFPAEAEEYETEEKLLNVIQEFIHKWVEVKPIYEKIASYYVLFDWLYDCFNELPYLRPLGDWGTGKTRFLKTIGSICYKPIFAGGAITSAPIFRILQEIQGTFIMDEGDFRNSESWSDIIKILNTGYERGLPVLRCEGEKNEPKAFRTYGPKILGTRELFNDQALESRCLTIEMETKTRDDILENLPNSFYEEATYIRNKMLLWRFRNYGKRELNPKLREKSIEPRLNQIIIPLLSVVKEDEARNQIKEFIKDYNKQLREDRGGRFEAEVVEAILEILTAKEEPLMQAIADKLNEKYGYEEKDKRQFNGRYIGSIVRKKLNLHPQRRGKGYTITPDGYEKVYNLADKFGIDRSLGTKTDKELQKEADRLVDEHPEEFNQEDEINANKLPL